MYKLDFRDTLNKRRKMKKDNQNSVCSDAYQYHTPGAKITALPSTVGTIVGIDYKYEVPLVLVQQYVLS